MGETARFLNVPDICVGNGAGHSPRLRRRQSGHGGDAVRSEPGQPRNREVGIFQIRIHGRGGQGVVSAAEMLSVTAFLEGAHAQAFPSFGSERMGAPVIAFCRIDDKEIRLREPRQRHAGRRLLRARHSHHRKEKNDQETDHPEPPLEPSATSGLTSNQDGPDPLLRNRLRRPKCFDDGHPRPIKNATL